MRGHIYDFSPRAICTYMNILVSDDAQFEKYFVLDDVAVELLGYKCVWPNSNILKVADLNLKYNGLHKIALCNWLPTKHVTVVSRDFATKQHDISTSGPMHLS